MSEPDGVFVPGHLCRAMAVVATIGGDKLMADNGGLRLADGLTAVIFELGQFKNEPHLRIVGAREGRWVTSAEAAVIAGVSWQAITRLCRRGRLIARRNGYAWMIDRQSVEDYRKDRGG
jgi:hypothetical protein